MNARPVQPAALLHNISGGIALVHKSQRLAVAGFHPYRQAVIPRPTQAGQLLVRLERYIRNPRKASDGLDGGHILANQAGDGHQPVIPEHKRIRPGQKGPPDALRPGPSLKPRRQHSNWVRAPQLRLPQVALHILQRRHSEWERQLVIKGAKFASVVGTSRRHLKQQRGRLIGRPPDGSCVVHSKPSLFFCHYSTVRQNKKYGTFLQYLAF